MPGRPTIYTQELGNKICQRISEGESVRSIAKDNEMPNASTIHAWVLDNDHFSKQYMKACNLRADLMFEELEEIADLSDEKESHQRSRLRVDTRKWYLSKIMPKKYGDKLDLTTDGEKLPTPIYIPRNDSTEENSESQETN